MRRKGLVPTSQYVMYTDSFFYNVLRKDYLESVYIVAKEFVGFAFLRIDNRMKVIGKRKGFKNA